MGLLGEVAVFEEPDLLDEAVPPGLWLLEVVPEGFPKERCDWVGFAMARDLAAIFSAFGETAGVGITELGELLMVDPAVRDFMVSA